MMKIRTITFRTSRKFAPITTLFVWTALVVLVGGPIYSGEPADTIDAGIDVWQTGDGGGSGVNFKYDPIPKDFFCEGSPIFDGYIALRGQRLKSDNPQLGNTDTLIERLDSVSFGRNNKTVTRTIIRALSLVGLEPLRIPCDHGTMDWEVSVALRPGFDEESYTSELTIARPSSRAAGGTFHGTVLVPARITFSSGGRSLILDHDVKLEVPENPPSQWTYAPGRGGVIVTRSLVVDGDGDGVMETEVPGTSNFNPGWSVANHPTVASDISHADGLGTTHLASPSFPSGGTGGDDCDDLRALQVIGDPGGRFNSLRGRRLVSEVMAGERCRLVITDTWAAKLGAQACSSKELGIFDTSGKQLEFTVEDDSLCVLEVR